MTAVQPATHQAANNPTPFFKTLLSPLLSLQNSTLIAPMK
uniref:Uncharacterized protein n=1 Tax=Anguilla anguilla TaxID=7936 RepID=A0A0E9VIJ6_ANGAN